MAFKTLLAAAALVAGVLPASAGGLGTLLPPYALGPQNPMIASETWEVLRSDIAGDAVLLDGDALIAFDVPVSASDPTTVPFTIEQRPGTERIARLAVVIDENPAPVVATFEIGAQMGDVFLQARARYDVFSNIRAIATTERGATYMVGRFVQAAGGCSLAVTRDVNEALATMGQMDLTIVEDPSAPAPRASGIVREAEIRIQHPSFTGMQMHSGTLDPIDPRYINEVEVWLGEDRLFRMTGGFSISENPAFRFRYVDNGSETLRVLARDSDGTAFTQTFALNRGV